MHVVLEGIAPVHLGLFLKQILVHNPALSIEAFNHKVKSNHSIIPTLKVLPSQVSSQVIKSVMKI